MGCIVSYCKNRTEYDESFMIKKYCFQCSKILTPKEYDKHIKKCTERYLKRLDN